MKPVIPILRIFDEEKGKDFYFKYLGFSLEWEHRFEENFPLYMEISQGECIIHLSEHHGDATPGSSIRIEMENIEAFHQQLMAKNYKYAKPGLEKTPWNTKEITIGDPFGNRIIFYERM